MITAAVVDAGVSNPRISDMRCSHVTDMATTRATQRHDTMMMLMTCSTPGGVSKPKYYGGMLQRAGTAKRPTINMLHTNAFRPLFPATRQHAKR